MIRLAERYNRGALGYTLIITEVGSREVIAQLRRSLPAPAENKADGLRSMQVAWILC